MKPAVKDTSHDPRGESFLIYRAVMTPLHLPWIYIYMVVRKRIRDIKWAQYALARVNAIY